MAEHVRPHCTLRCSHLDSTYNTLSITQGSDNAPQNSKGWTIRGGNGGDDIAFFKAYEDLNILDGGAFNKEILVDGNVAFKNCDNEQCVSFLIPLRST